MRETNQLAWVAAFGAAVTMGCSVLYDLSPDQCGRDADCASFGASYRCSEGLCQPDPAATGGTSGTGPMGECETAADCQALVGANTFEVQPAACIEGTPGEPGSRTCVDLKTTECPVLLPSIDQGKVLENLLGNNPIILGAYGYLPDTLISNFTRAYDLAFTELTRKRNGLPGPNGSNRPLVVVVCNNLYEDRTVLDASLTHLIDHLKVPGIISALSSDDLQYAFEGKGLAANVFFMSPVESDPTLASIQDNDLLWHLLPTAETVGLPYKPLLTRTIDYLRERGDVAAGETIKVALVTGTDQRFLNDLQSAIYETIEFNGMSAAQNRSEGNLVSLSVTSFYSDQNAPNAQAIQGILDLGPHVVIGITAHELFARIIPVVESRWTSDVGSSQPRPFYLLSPYNYNNGQYLRTVVIDHPNIHLRMAGVNYASAPDELKHILEAYELAFDTEFPEVAGRRGYENFYDAAYYLMYGIAAGTARLSRFDGRHIVDGMRRLLDGEAFAVGPNDIPPAFSRLSDPLNKITLNGTLGAPNFDSTEARTDPGSVWCVMPDALEAIDVLRYDEGELVGTFPCNPDF